MSATYPILSAEFIAPDVKLFRIEAPYIARKHQAGQFVVLRVHAEGERIPITIIVQGIGRTTRELKRLGMYRNQEKKAHEKWHCEK